MVFLISTAENPLNGILNFTVENALNGILNFYCRKPSKWYS